MKLYTGGCPICNWRITDFERNVIEKVDPKTGTKTYYIKCHHCDVEVEAKQIIEKICRCIRCKGIFTILENKIRYEQDAETKEIVSYADCPMCKIEVIVRVGKEKNNGN